VINAIDQSGSGNQTCIVNGKRVGDRPALQKRQQSVQIQYLTEYITAR